MKKKRRGEKLKKALKKTDELPNEWFGDESIDIVDFPVLEKELKDLSDFKALENHKVLEDGTVEMTLNYNHTYSGNLEFFTEQGMEGRQACILHDDRGLNSKGFKNLSWAVFIKGGEYLKVFENDKVIWEGLVIRNYEKVLDKDFIRYSILPYGVDQDVWEKWFNKQYKAEISTLKPVLAEDPEYADFKLG